MTRRYGWIKDAPDPRDFRMAPLPVANLPASIDLRVACPPIYDQGELGSCTANATAAALQFERMKQKLADAAKVPSRLFIYYGERLTEHTVDQDSGAQIRDGIKWLHKHGACFEGDGPADWPYDIGKFTQRPPRECFEAARKDRALLYQRVPQQIDQLRARLAQGYPVAFGFTVYESFESEAVAKTGIMPMPKAGEKILGGHAVLAAGYDDAKQIMIVRNSWGEGWGQAGYFEMPYAFISDPQQASDFWTISLVSNDGQ